MGTDLALIDPDQATALEIRTWTANVAARIPSMDREELDLLEAALAAVRKRLQQLSADVAEAERARIKVLRRRGELLGPAEIGRPGKTLEDSNVSARSGSERFRDHEARLLAAYPNVVDEELKSDNVSLAKVVAACQDVRRAEARNRRNVWCVVSVLSRSA